MINIKARDKLLTRPALQESLAAQSQRSSKPDVRSCPEISDAAAAYPLHILLRTAVGWQVISQRHDQPYVVLRGSRYHIIQPLA